MHGFYHDINETYTGAFKDCMNPVFIFYLILKDKNMF